MSGIDENSNRSRNAASKLMLYIVLMLVQETFWHIVTITDASDAPTINFSTTSIDDGTAETTQANNDYTLDIDLSIQSGKNLKFSYSTLTNPGTATPGQDFEALIGEFVITAGNTVTVPFTFGSS